MNHIIGDVHGCFYTLEKLIQRVQDLDDKAYFIFIGDYVDRGQLNKEVVEYAIDLQNKGNALCLRGNHDNVIDWILNDDGEKDGLRVGHYKGNISEYVRDRPTFDNVIPWWRVNGLDETLASYGATQALFDSNEPVDPNRIAQEFREKVPQSHKDFFRNLPLFWENETHFACHAFFRPNEELPDIFFLPVDMMKHFGQDFLHII